MILRVDKQAAIVCWFLIIILIKFNTKATTYLRSFPIAKMGILSLVSTIIPKGLGCFFRKELNLWIRYSEFAISILIHTLEIMIVLMIT